MRISRQYYYVILPFAVLMTSFTIFRIFRVIRPSCCSSRGSIRASGSSFDGSEFNVNHNVDAFDIPIHPFEAGKPKFLVILAYQRSGSTFFGNLFNTNPNAFFIYEPLDSLYSSLYGIKQGWSVPTDLTTYPDGSNRIIPEFELKKVSQFLQTLLLCDMKSLPTEALVHRYMFAIINESLSLKEYSECLQQKKLEKAMKSYMKWMPWPYCGERFGEISEQRQNECNLLLNDEEYRKKHSHHTNISLFKNYLAHASNLRRAVTVNCLKLFTDACSRFDLRATKVVRASMRSMEPLLRKLPNFRVIHLIRDPRAVVLSRSNFPSSGGLFSKVDYNGSMILEAELYCKTVVSDVRIRTELEKTYRGKIYTIVYDDMVKHFKKYAEKVYEFMDSPIPKETQSMIDEVDENRNSSIIANHWQYVLTFQEHSDIWKGCREFFQLIDYDWPR